MKYLVSVSERVYYQSLEIEADDEDQAGEIYMDKLMNGYVLDVNQEFEEIKVRKLDKNGKTNKIYCGICQCANVELNRPIDDMKDHYICTMCIDDHKNSFNQSEIIDASSH